MKAPIKITNVRKVAIVSYSDDTLLSQIGEFFVPVNPTNYAEGNQVNHDCKRGIGQQGTNTRYKSTSPETLKLEFILDSTGTIEGYVYKDLGIQEQVEMLRSTVYLMNGEIHRPNFCKVFWGALVFPCVLSKLDIQYPVFDNEGVPIRAKVTAEFTQFLPTVERERLEGKSSPDLTHIRTVTAGDRLDLMAYKLYTEKNFILQVAKANGLTSFRDLAPGTEIVFPPLDKTEV